MPRPEGLPSISEMHDKYGDGLTDAQRKKLQKVHKKAHRTYVEVVRTLGISTCDRAEHTLRCIEARMACKAELEKQGRADLVRRMNKDETLFDKLRGGC